MIFWYSFVMFLIFELLFLFAFAKRRKIFIDLGTNDGTSVKQFVSGATGSNTAADGSKSLVGGWESFLSGVSEYNSTGWDIIALEANDQHLPSLTALKANLLDGNHTHVDSVSLYCPTAITTKNGQVEFIWDSPDGGYAGSTLMAGSRSAVGKRVLVPALDIITLFKREKISMKDFVVVKMDVEGAEYSIVRRILLSGIWRYIDRIAVEWHHNAYFVFGHPGHNTSEPNYQERLDRHFNYKKQYESLVWMAEGLDITWQFQNWGR